MALIYESKHFIVESADPPLVDRCDGGHIIINPKERVEDIQKLLPEQAIELVKLLMITGDAMKHGLNNNGVDVGRINYQDNGNWGVFLKEGPYQHFHLYGRAKDAKYQLYGQACFFPHKSERPEFYASLEPLRKEDVESIRELMIQLLNSDKYLDKVWAS